MGTPSIRHGPPQAGGPGVAGDKVPKPPRERQLANKPWTLQIQTPCNPKSPWKSRKDGKQQGNQHEARSEFKGNLQKSPATLWHLLPLAGTTCKGSNQPKAASMSSSEPNTATAPAPNRKKRGELSTRKPAPLHSGQSTDLSQLPLSIQLHPSN